VGLCVLTGSRFPLGVLCLFPGCPDGVISAPDVVWRLRPACLRDLVVYVAAQGVVGFQCYRVPGAEGSVMCGR